MLFGRSVLSHCECKFSELPPAPSHSFARWNGKRQDGLQGARHTALRRFDVTVQKRQAGYPLVDRNSRRSLTSIELLERSEGGCRMVIIAKFEQGVSQDLIGVAFARFKFN